MNSILEQKIKEKYQNPTQLLKVIRKHNSEVFLNNVFQLISEFTDKKSENELLSLANIILTKLNDVLFAIDNIEERKMVKYAITDIFKTDIRAVSQNLSEHFVPNLINTLKTSSFLLNNNYQELESLLGLKRFDILKSKRFLSTNAPYYDWLGREFELDEFTKDLKDKNIIHSIKDFKKLFSATEKTFFTVNKDKINDLVLIFSILKDLELIRPRLKSGYFSPLVQFALDDEQKVLFIKPPNKILYALKQKARNYEELRDNYQIWIQSLIKE
jgi:hypothetical protein